MEREIWQGKTLDLLGSLMKNIQITMLYFYIASYIKTSCVNLLWIWNLCLTLLWSWLMLFDLEGLLRQFREFLEFMQSEYSDILYYSKVRWLSAGRIYEWVWQLKDEIVTFFLEKQGSVEYKILEDTAWLSDFTFFYGSSLPHEQVECQDARQKSIYRWYLGPSQRF